MSETTALNPLMTVTWVFVGIVLSLVLPLAVRALKRVKIEGVAKKTFGERLAEAWTRYGGNRYLGALVGATLVAIVLVFLLGLDFPTTRDAALAGFAWESLLGKVLGGSGST
jgi:predicted membrane-bound spermidine synthase